MLESLPLGVSIPIRDHSNNEGTVDWLLLSFRRGRVWVDHIATASSTSGRTQKWCFMTSCHCPRFCTSYTTTCLWEKRHINTVAKYINKMMKNKEIMMCHTNYITGTGCLSGNHSRCWFLSRNIFNSWTFEQCYLYILISLYQDYHGNHS